jgi:hypothetical protein
VRPLAYLVALATFAACGRASLHMGTPGPDDARPTTYGLGGILPTETAWPSIDLGTRPAR